MKLYAIGDLHLSGTPPTKPMTVFGRHWDEHWPKIRESWQAAVTADDTVIICGDTSWAMQLETAVADLDELAALPGNKILLRGNHDYWWSTIKKMREATGGAFHFLQNNFHAAGDVAICGTRGWNLPGSPSFRQEDEAIYKRECLRFRASLELARAAGYKKIVAALHYPPLYCASDSSCFSELCREYGVKSCVFGHIHGEDVQNAFSGFKDGTDYRLVSADGVAFALQEIALS